MKLKEVYCKPEYIDFLYRNLTLSQHETILLKWQIKQKVEIYLDFGNKITDAFTLIANSGFMINEKKVFLNRGTIHRYYYELK